jgi:hypothetical protein
MSDILNQPLDYRCLALTGSLETAVSFPDCFGSVAGDFDGQGLSFGALQWNLGQGTLQPLLLQMEAVLDDRYAGLRAILRSPLAGQMAWAHSIQDARHRVAEPWRLLFHELGLRPEVQEIQRAATAGIYHRALNMCAAYGLKSERAVALLFDIMVQNGGLPASVKAQIDVEFRGLDAAEPEVTRLRVIANRMAESASPRWIEDVRARKLAIANGEGAVHGRSYDLEAQFGIRLQAVVA